jgi:hypothetical protein
MTSTIPVQTLSPVDVDSMQQQVESLTDSLLSALPRPEQLTASERRGIIARYSSVLEGNFIYWMTATSISVRSDEAREIIMENLHEEVRDSHPHMLRKFEIAANAVPTEADTMAVHDDLTKVRLLLGRLSGVKNVLTMAYFEGLIQKFMPYLAELARLQGSTEMEYTDVHGVCDVTHTQELYRALADEISLAGAEAEADSNLFEGVYLLHALMEKIVDVPAAAR